MMMMMMRVPPACPPLIIQYHDVPVVQAPLLVMTGAANDNASLASPGQRLAVSFRFASSRLVSFRAAPPPLARSRPGRTDYIARVRAYLIYLCFPPLPPPPPSPSPSQTVGPGSCIKSTDQRVRASGQAGERAGGCLCASPHHPHYVLARCASSLPTACKHLPNALVGIFEAGPRAWRPCLLGAGCWDPIHRSCCTHARTHARTSHLWISPNLYASYITKRPRGAWETELQVFLIPPTKVHIHQHFCRSVW
ncbi:hypothetical protein JOL62DRAFT_386526 [Phyllosticta paracitricarpa]|uniref:Uncharacterized protein n=1 Tax=Phyllosticta paracitricarpa TaxID=2016321 RepID=A0ABR1NHW0_9PEZI